MGMEVYAYTATPRTTPESKHDNGYIVPGTGDPTGSIPTKWFSGLDKPSLHTFLSSNLDVLLISLPLTAATHHFISTAELELLSSPGSPPSPSKQKLGGTFIANISRGQIIDQMELERFCREGKLRGAALDVTDPEPLPKESGLWDIEGVAVTPHVSGLSLAYIDRSLQILELNLNNLKTGKKLINIVDREKGY
ncbi:2-hydroxyacid dehydrogenase protein [Rutstroemia sp. NJR-2017a BVV2]|nr:2-hydroxyacid dehydrogenase protein [Rutstroemia sp. NJR-2017a BVV2]